MRTAFLPRRAQMFGMAGTVRSILAVVIMCRCRFLRASAALKPIMQLWRMNSLIGPSTRAVLTVSLGVKSGAMKATPAKSWSQNLARRFFALISH